MTLVYDTTRRLVSVYDTGGRLVWGQNDGGTPLPSIPEPELVPLTRRLAIGGQHARLGETVGTLRGRNDGITVMTPHMIYTEADDIQVTWTGHWMTAGNSLPLRASIRVGGRTYPLTFDGQPEGTLTQSAHLVSDPVALGARTVPGDVMEVRTYWGPRATAQDLVGARGRWYSYEIMEGDETGRKAAWPTFAESDAAGGKTWLGRSGYRPPMPLAITGMVPDGTMALLGVGDSIMESGSVSPVQPITVRAEGAMGTWLDRAAEDTRTAWVNAGWWGSTAAIRATGGHIPDPGLFTHVIVQWSYNDLNQAAQTGADWESVRDSLIAAWREYADRGLVVAATTTTPNSTSTDGWATVEGQTPVASSASHRAPYRAWLRDGAPLPTGERVGEPGHPLAAVLDTDATLRHGGLDDIFRVDEGPLVQDGGHPLDVGHRAMSVPVRDWLASQ